MTLRLETSTTRAVEVRELPAPDVRGASAASYELVGLRPGVGGAELRPRVVCESMFAAAAMRIGGDTPFEEMKVTELKAELDARGASRSGLKHVLQRKLHSLLLQEAMGAAEEDGGTAAGIDSSDDGEADSSDNEELAASSSVDAQRPGKRQRAGGR